MLPADRPDCDNESIRAVLGDCRLIVITGFTFPFWKYKKPPGELLGGFSRASSVLLIPLWRVSTKELGVLGVQVVDTVREINLKNAN